MGGRKGRSGRKSLYEELDIQALIKKSGYILNQWLDDSSVPLGRKIQVVSEIIKRRIPNEVKVDNKITFNVKEKEEYTNIRNRLYNLNEIVPTG